MPVSAYLKAGLFLVAAAAALFAAAGTVAIPGFWAYLAILAAVMIVSFAALDQSGPPARTHAAGRQEAAALAKDLLPRSVHARSRPVTPWHYGPCA
jgi:hypothetical protein